ncbi:flagellar hook-basal body complex protein FliE [Jatrophihabitans cynanchi]|uniref:Flagellar hook-basal body complex protein FliE n=1 Tax=Jatrophihabitans cynanchi TaxID=2944128 RepID=A0ABY7JTT6_9ACTN|nr:flagellar hook-basal body complex protein FliE [Jatrophihabitans sp. SB3-54]WAX55445.1 flagellar hook-basal body complex protein FliE [Jatrophihabitans sp. SB3-54]
MVVPIAPIGAIAPLGAAAPAAATQPPTTSGADFATALGHGLDAVTGAQANADSLAVQAATGQLVDPAQLTIATTQATLMTQLASTLQSKAVTAFNTIMGMQA